MRWNSWASVALVATMGLHASACGDDDETSKGGNSIAYQACYRMFECAEQEIGDGGAEAVLGDKDAYCDSMHMAWDATQQSWVAGACKNAFTEHLRCIRDTPCDQDLEVVCEATADAANRHCGGDDEDDF